MNRTDRLYALREELRRAGSLGRTAEQLAGVFEVSVRTVKRDISTLQAGGFPVWARIGRTGGYVVDADATLPPVNLTPSEVSGLAAALASHSGAPFDAHARSALVKILNVSAPTTRDRAQRLADRIWINRDEEAAFVVDAAVRAAVEDALADQRVLRIDYRDRNGNVSRRLVDPQILGWTGGVWYLVAHCRTRDALRWFRLDRILDARLTTHAATDRPVADIGRPPSTAHAVAELGLTVKA